jgi:hypothetical protein
MSDATGARLSATLNDLFLFAMMLALAAILTVAMVLQLRRRNPLPAVPVAAGGDVRGMLRRHPAFPRWLFRAQ